jgi:hypothetical protein
MDVHCFRAEGDVARLEQIEEMALGREDRPVTRSDGSADTLCLAGFP